MQNTIHLSMSERSDRLRQAFQQSTYAMNGLSPRATALKLGWNENTFRSNMNGNMPFSFDSAKAYAAKLKVRAEWLYDGAGAMRESPPATRVAPEIPLFAWVSAGQLADVGDVDSLEQAERIVVGDLPSSGSYFATQVVGDSMDRVSPNGSKIVVNAADRSPKAGGFYLFSVKGETTFKRYQSRPVRRLEPYSTNPANESIFLGEKNWSCIGRVVRSIFDLT